MYFYKQKQVTESAELSVDEVYEAMSEGERIHMANKLWKHDYRPAKALKYAEQMSVVWETDEYLLIEKEVS